MAVGRPRRSSWLCFAIKRLITVRQQAICDPFERGNVLDHRWKSLFRSRLAREALSKRPKGFFAFRQRATSCSC
jgi:hypothetical protein